MLDKNVKKDGRCMSAGLFPTPTEQHLPGWVVGGGGGIVEPNPRDRPSVGKKKQNS